MTLLDAINQVLLSATQARIVEGDEKKALLLEYAAEQLFRLQELEE